MEEMRLAVKKMTDNDGHFRQWRMAANTLCYYPTLNNSDSTIDVIIDVWQHLE